ncbi:MAG: hypothetical protein ACK5MQ_05010, partial [Pikeienuella sp.]
MSGLERIGDFFIWIGETLAALSPPRPPLSALGVENGEALLYRRKGVDYMRERAARPGDSAPFLLSAEQAFAARLVVAPEVALHGIDPARLEAARRSPVPLAEAEWALARAPEAWAEGAPWRFAAAPKRRLEALRETLRVAGAAPGPAFAMVEGAPMTLRAGGPRRAKTPMAAAAIVML